MSKFSEESLLLIRNWDAYKDILKSGEHLKTELNSVRSAIEGRLRKQDWWNDRWVFWKNDPTQIAFTDSRWEIEDGHLIWVGLEGFAPDAVFGDDPPPFMYVWISGKRPELKVELQRIIKVSGKTIVGDFPKAQTSYVVEKSLSKCLPEQVDKLEDMMFFPLADFCEFYSQFFEEFNKAAQKHLKIGK